MNGYLLTLDQVYAAEGLRIAARLAEATAPPPAPRSLERINVDERNIERSRGIYFNTAYELAGSHCNADAGIPANVALGIQEKALREAADMVAARLKVGVERHQLERAARRPSR